MPSLFLIGGGWNPDGFESTYGRFIKVATQNKNCKILIIIADENDHQKNETINAYLKVFRTFGVDDHQIESIFLTPASVFDIDSLDRIKPTGVFVGGGLTPLYQEKLCSDRGWIQYLKDYDIPYAGFSAGSAIASTNAIVGGWQITIGEKTFSILDSDLAENLDFIEIRPGLGLTEHSIDAHASQWGTISRVLHSVDQNRISSGWAIDESTMMQITNNEINVYGLGQVYFIEKEGKGECKISIYRDGDNVPK